MLCPSLYDSNVRMRKLWPREVIWHLRGIREQNDRSGPRALTSCSLSACALSTKEEQNHWQGNLDEAEVLRVSF